MNSTRHWFLAVVGLIACTPLAMAGETYDTEIASIDSVSLSVVILDGIPDTSRTKIAEVLEAETVALATKLLAEVGVKVSDNAPISMYIFGDCDGPSESGNEAALMMSLEISEEVKPKREIDWFDSHPFQATTWLYQEVKLFKRSAFHDVALEMAESLVSEFVRKHEQAKALVSRLPTR